MRLVTSRRWHVYDKTYGKRQRKGRGSSDRSTANKVLLRCRKITRFASFNACTIRESPKAMELAYRADQLDIEILGIQEHRIVHQAETEFRFTCLENHYLVTSSARRNDVQATVGGVGMLLSGRAKKALSDIRSFSLRVLVANFAGSPATTTTVAYSPTNVSDINEIENFYEHLRAAIRSTPSHNFLTTLGDFNARLGSEEVRFPFHDTTNRNGEFLAELLAEHDLLAANTNFNKRMGKRWTFCDRGTQTKRQLDYILVRRKWRNSILNAEAYNSLEALGSDHRLVTAKIRLSLRVPKQKSKQFRLIGDN